MTVPRISLAILAIMAVLFSVNLVTSANRFVNAYRVYDRFELAMTRFSYTSPDDPVEIVMVVSNPTEHTFTVQAIDIRLDIGVHRVGGGILYLDEPVQFPPGHMQEFPMELRINDRTYVRRLNTPTPDWRVTGEIQVVLGSGIEPEWVRFTVRQLPE